MAVQIWSEQTPKHLQSYLDYYLHQHQSFGLYIHASFDLSVL